MLVDKTTPIIIYGAAANGMRGYHSLKQINGYHVVGFFDKRASEIGTQYGLPVWSIGDDTGLKQDECIVFICVKNVFEHASIANQLIDSGFKHVVFKPIDLITANSIFQEIGANYDKVFNDINPDSKYHLSPVPEISAIPLNSFEDSAVIECNENSVLANIPLEAIFVKGKPFWNVLSDSYGNVNAACLAPHISLFRYFDNGLGSADSYLDFCASTIGESEARFGGEEGGTIKDTPAWRKCILENRFLVFKKMAESLELDYRFFIDHAPYVALDETDRFVIKSAKHRLAFFLEKKRNYIPVRLPRGDYARWLNESHATALIKYLNESKTVVLDVPIQHPLLYKFPSKRFNYYDALVYPAAFELSKLIGNSRKPETMFVIDAIEDYGAIARYASAIGFQSAFCNKNKKASSIIPLLDALFGVQTSSISSVKNCDVLFADNTTPISWVLELSPDVLFFVGNLESRIANDYEPPKTLSNVFWEGESKTIAMYIKTIASH